MQFNLSLDDFSPHERAGLHFESIEWCNKLIDKYPDIKINLFTPAAYCRLGEDPCYLTKNMKWVEQVKKIPSNYRINLHGYYHRRLSQKHGPSNNDEWQFLNEEQAKILFTHMVGEFDSSGLKYYKTFRPPGWKISTSSAKVLTDNDFIIAGDKKYFDLISGKVSGLKWVYCNWDLVTNPPESECVVAYGHTSDWTNNYMNKERYQVIVEFLDRQRDVSFEFIEDLI